MSRRVFRGRVWRCGKPQDDFEFDTISEYHNRDHGLCGQDVAYPGFGTTAGLLAGSG